MSGEGSSDSSDVVLEWGYHLFYIVSRLVGLYSFGQGLQAILAQL